MTDPSVNSPNTTYKFVSYVKDRTRRTSCRSCKRLHCKCERDNTSESCANCKKKGRICETDDLEGGTKE
ncbi:hypothetical protein PNOK_0012600 [Pyrrhoderma noxium]|uniref:Zn(2)-C6 fungal-type domain-containing protein n=1 Tax=Pyrrhoderma noxium TaxID=2282107 RepID=A0A286UU04_9AGAM|nr:hypothetical protein PNOK_0012600 [Pyrrhoderma noxium]